MLLKTLHDIKRFAILAERSTRIALTRMTAVPLLLCAGLVPAGCDSAEEAIADFDSTKACEHYCAKKFECDGKTPSKADSDKCFASCRNAIENNCGNDHQVAANDKIEECVDKGCTDFKVCMVFSAAPVCFAFTND